MISRELRTHAEQQVKLRDRQAFKDMSDDDIARLIFELETHQIELEMQNEALHNAQQDLAEKRDLYADLYDNAPIGYVTTDKKGVIRQSNLTFSQMLAIDTLSLIGQPLAAFVAREDLDGFHIVRMRALKSGQRESCELRLCTRLDECLWVGLDCTFVRNSGGECRFATSDISAKKQAESGLRKIQNLKSIRSLAEGIADELNQIMTLLFGDISMARMKLAEGHPAIKFLDKSEVSINRAESLSYQLLLFAKEGKPVGELLNLAELVQESLSYNLKDSGLSVVFESPEDLWVAKADKKQIQKVFSNLIKNARQAMPDGGHLFVNHANAAIPENVVMGLCKGRYIKTTLRDEGKGMEQKVLDEILDPVSGAMKIGKGLGLATVYSIVSNHGGHVGVESEPGKGTTFAVYLPAA